MMRKGIIGAICTAVILTAACVAAQAKSPKEEGPHPWAKIDRAVAVLHPTAGNTAHGTITFRQLKGKVEVVVHVEGLEPNSVHGIHVHEFGDCTAEDGSSAGGHYNPQSHEHGLPAQAMRHAGDLGNLKANDKGVADYTITVDNITIAGRKNPVVGRGVILHAKEDTGAQPTGDAGGRMACGVIGIAKSE